MEITLRGETASVLPRAIFHPTRLFIPSDNGVDLIVMSTHGRTGLARWAYGSVANKVLTAAPCPVLLVRAQFSID